MEGRSTADSYTMPLFRKTSRQQQKPVFFVKNRSDSRIAEAKPPTQDSALKTEKKQSKKEWVLSLVMLFSYVALNSLSAQLSNLAFTDSTLNFHAPYLYVLFKIGFRCLAFPIYLLVNTVVKLIRQRKLDFPRTWKRCVAVCGEEKLTIRVIFFKFFPATIFNLLVQIGFTLAIQNLSASLASALAPPVVATSYLMAWIFFRSRMLFVKVFFVFVSFGGVALIVYDKFRIEITTATVIGISAMMIQDLAMSSYQICFKKSFPKGDLGQVSFAVSGMYLLMFLIYFPVPVILYLMGWETYDLSKLPYPYLICSWMSTSVSSIVYGYGLVIAGGFFMGLCELLILATNSGIDAMRHIVIPTAQIIGTLIIGGAFIVLILPDRYVSVKIRARFPQTWRFKIAKPKSTESQTVLEISDNSQGFFGKIEPNSSIDSSAIGEEDVLENEDLHINAIETQIKL